MDSYYDGKEVEEKRRSEEQLKSNKQTNEVKSKAKGEKNRKNKNNNSFKSAIHHEHESKQRNIFITILGKKGATTDE